MPGSRQGAEAKLSSGGRSGAGGGTDRDFSAQAVTPSVIKSAVASLRTLGLFAHEVFNDRTGAVLGFFDFLPGFCGTPGLFGSNGGRPPGRRAFGFQRRRGGRQFGLDVRCFGYGQLPPRTFKKGVACKGHERGQYAGRDVEADQMPASQMRRSSARRLTRPGSRMPAALSHRLIWAQAPFMSPELIMRAAVLLQNAPTPML